VNACSHPSEQQVRSVYYVLCGLCKTVLLVSYCNYAQECHPHCSLPGVCLQSARERYHAAVPLQVPSAWGEAARARIESREPADS
jgi:hypothetical protein